jgi:transposase
MMTKLFSILICTALMFNSSVILAHGDEEHSHGHEKAIDAAKAQAIAKKAVLETANKGKIEYSWTSAKANKPTTKDFGHGKEFVVTFDNAKAKDAKKRKLFVFVSSAGKVLGLNFTGN